MSKLHFVSAPGGSAFMHELLTVIAHEVRQLGNESPFDEITVSEGTLPMGNDDVYVVIPHEYFVVLPLTLHPSPDQLARTIGFCVEHPGNTTFQTTTRYARRLAACVDLNDVSTMMLNALGIPTERFVLGYSECWDRWGGGEVDRPHDVLYLGTSDERRSRLLVLDNEVLDGADVLFAMPPHEPMTRPRPDFFMGEAKFQLLAGSKVLLNLHRGSSRSLEWVRVLEAMCNGCVVVSEHSLDIAPLVPGRHLLLGRPRTLAHLARSVLRDPSLLTEIRTTCYAMLRSELTMRPSALLLAQLAGEVAAGIHKARRPPDVQVSSVQWPTELPGELVDEAKDRRPGPMPYRADWLEPPSRLSACTEVVGSLRSDGDLETLDVALIRSAGMPDISVALASLLPQISKFDVTIHLCFDGVDVGELPGDLRVVTHGNAVRTGAGALLNRALEASNAANLLILGTSDQLASRAVELLQRALRTDRFDAAYGMVVDPRGLLTSALPFERDRVAKFDYLALAALWRRASLLNLGGWSEDPGLDGAETWDLWRRLADSGGSATLVPRPLVRQAFSQDPALTAFDIDPYLVGCIMEEHAESGGHVRRAVSS